MIIAEKISDEMVDDEKLANFQRAIVLPLPLAYREFLKTHNGGRPSPSGFEFKNAEGKSESSRVHYFYGLHDGEIGNLLEESETFKDRVPFGYLAIACDPFGNQIVIKLIAIGKAPVFFWDDENEAEDDPTMENMHLIAPSFDDFLKSIKDRPVA